MAANGLHARARIGAYNARLLHGSPPGGAESPLGAVAYGQAACAE